MISAICFHVYQNQIYTMYWSNELAIYVGISMCSTSQILQQWHSIIFCDVALEQELLLPSLGTSLLVQKVLVSD